MAEPISARQAVMQIKEIAEHAKRYRREAEELVTLAREAARHDRFDLEHDYLAQSRTKMMCAALVTSTAQRMIKAVLASTSARKQR
jgi:ribosomal protein L17